jgi:hypothetical protein
MDAEKLFPSKWLKAADLKGREVEVIIDHAEPQPVGEDKEQRLVIYFVGLEKGLVVNKTNYSRIKAEYGSETNDWKDKKLVLYTIVTNYKDEEVDALRVKIPGKQPLKRE